MASRLALPKDAESIGQIRVKAWQAAYRDFMPLAFLEALDPTANLDHLRANLASATPSFVARVVESEGNVVAFSLLGQPRYEAAAGTLELWAINVLPTHWRSGHGALLVRTALQDASAQQASALELWCIEGNVRARHLYSRCGFIDTGAIRTTTGLTGHPLHEVHYRIAL